MKVEWESTAIQELDISATDLSSECLMDILVRIPGLRFLAAGQINGFTDAVNCDFFFFELVGVGTLSVVMIFFKFLGAYFKWHLWR